MFEIGMKKFLWLKMLKILLRVHTLLGKKVGVK